MLSSYDRSSWRERSVVLYGAGRKGLQLQTALEAMNAHVVAAIDMNPGKSQLLGIPVYAPNDPKVRELVNAQYLVVISAFNYTVNNQEIAGTLRELGFNTIMRIEELRQYVEIPETYWLATPSEMEPSDSDAHWLINRLSDSLSKFYLREWMQVRRDPRYEVKCIPDLKNTYCPADIGIRLKDLRFIDGGAFDGDTIRLMRCAGVTFREITAFEPDLRNFERLVTNITESAPETRITLFPIGLFNSLKRVTFEGGNGASAAISEIGCDTVTVAALDDVLPRCSVDYVKLDVEGAEFEAIEGMKGLLQRNRPTLAVSLYHKPDDLWRIPKLVDSILPEHEFFLRSHGWNWFDTVLYACPRAEGAC
jgi:FkbM family methyltransferase